MSRSPSPASPAPRLHRARRWWALPLVVLAVLALTASLGSRSVVAAVADPPANILDTPIVDAAFVDRGVDGSPDVLTLSIDPTAPSNARLTLLQKGATWAVRSQRDLDMPAAFDGYNAWLTQLSPTRFLSTAVTNDGTSELRLISVDAADQGAIAVGDPVSVGLYPTGTGVADVDGDGTPEIVVAGGINETSQNCQPAAITVLPTDGKLGLGKPGRLVRVKSSNGQPIAYFSGMSLGQWDNRPGTDILANAYECGAARQLPSDPHHLMAIRLADMTTIKDLPTSEADAISASPSGNMPAVIDMDHDGINEAVVATSAGSRVIDPENGWRATPFGDHGEALVAAIDGSPNAALPGTALVFLRHSGDATQDGVAVTRLSRVDGAVRIDRGLGSSLPWLSGQTLDSAVARLRDNAWPDQPPVTVVDVDGDSCPDLLAPGVLVGCGGTGVIEPSPAWVATRPLGVLTGRLGRTLLVADGLDWGPGLTGPMAPSPAAVHPPGTWRPNMVSRFVLAEVPLAVDATGPRIPVTGVPAPTIVHAQTQDGRVDVERPAGTRLLARITGYSDNAPAQGPRNLLTPDGFQLTDGTENEWYGTTAYLAPNNTGLPPEVGVGFGSGGGQETLHLARDLAGFENGVATHWAVTLAALDASGTLSQPVQRIAGIDTDAPPLSVDIPSTSAPWPFTATLHGMSETGATVTLKGGASVTAGDDGSFAVPVQLAPWPQSYDLIATDEAGNATATSVSVMGGVDLRGLPWPAIGVGLVLVAVVLSSIRGVRGGPRQVRPLAVDVDDENATVMEELSSGRIDRRN